MYCAALLTFAILSVVGAFVLRSFLPLLNVGLAVLGACAMKHRCHRRRPQQEQAPQPDPHRKWRRQKKKLALAILSGILIYKLAATIIIVLGFVLGGKHHRHHHRRAAFIIMGLTFIVQQVVLFMNVKALKFMLCKKKHRPHPPQPSSAPLPNNASEYEAMSQQTIPDNQMDSTINISYLPSVNEQPPQQQQISIENEMLLRQKFQNHLNVLRDMGFTDEKTNLELLEKYDGNLSQVVQHMYM